MASEKQYRAMPAARSGTSNEPALDLRAILDAIARNRAQEDLAAISLLTESSAREAVERLDRVIESLLADLDLIDQLRSATEE
jgi:hypothetical protein